MRTSKADRLALMFLVGVALLGLLAPALPALTSVVRQHVLPEHALVPGLVYRPASSGCQSGGHP